MKVKPLLHQSDLRPLEFTLAVTVGGLGTAVLSGLQINPLFSVIFALLVMLVLSFLRWQIASEYRDYEALEAFAEDIYLLGYLLTLSALLGLAPRLMSDDTNLFHIAGLKLLTTVVGLALMMIFRQTARRWAEEESRVSGDKFREQQNIFSDAVARLNEGADALTNKLDEVVRRFDPGLLVPMADWSNRAAESFATASQSMDKVAATVGETAKSLDAFNYGLNRVRVASGELAGVFTTETSRAAGALAADLSHAGQAANAMGHNLTALQPAGDAARETLVKLSTQANLGVTQFNHISTSLNRVAEELGKIDGLLKSFSELNSVDVKTPLNRLVEALDVTVATTKTSTEHLESLKSELHEVRTASQNLARSMEAEIATPLANHQQVVEKVSQQVARADDQLGKVSAQLEAINGARQSSSEILAQLLTRMRELQAELNKTNVQIKAAGDRFDGRPVAGGKPGLFSGLFGGGR